MIGVINQPLRLVFILIFLYGTVARQVQINGNITNKIGTNGTMLVCNFTFDQGYRLISVWILATNMTSRDFQNVASFDTDYGPILQSFGKVLFGNASLSSVNKSSKRVSFSFDDLHCKHSRLYKCRLVVKSKDTPSIETDSEAIGISIQVPPSKPDNVLLVPTPADVSVSSTSNVDYSSASPSTAVTSNENETVSASETGKQNTAHVSNNFKIPTPGPNTTFSLLQEDISTSYRTTTYYIPKSTTSQGIAEGDNITVVCTGDVGNPPGEHLFQKYRNGKIFHIHEKVYATSNSDMYENCSYYRTSNLTFQVSADDNNVVIRCVVNSSMADPAMYVETAPIEVYYPVRMPTIINYPNKTDYVLGEDTSIHLACKSDGNPKPSYFWYKENPKQQVSSNENFTLTNLNITNSGTYTCKVNNTFHGDVYQNATIVNIKIINTADKTTPSTSGSGLNKAKDNRTVIVVVVVVLVVVVLIVIGVVVVLQHRRIRTKEEYKPVDRMESNTDQIESQEATQTVPSTSSTLKTTGYEDVDLDDTDMKFKLLCNVETIAQVKQHNEEYWKKLKEDEEREKDNPTQPPQAAVYACVNKPKSTVTTENKPPAEQLEEDVYEESKEGLYDTSGDRRHKENITVENYDSTEKEDVYEESKEGLYDTSGDRRHKEYITVEKYDSTENRKNEESDHNALFSEQNSQIGAYIHKLHGSSENKDEKRQIATVSPTVRLSSSSQGDGQKHKGDEIQPKTEKPTTQETFL